MHTMPTQSKHSSELGTKIPAASSARFHSPPNQPGFHWVELIIVLCVLTLILAIVMPRLRHRFSAEATQDLIPAVYLANADRVKKLLDLGANPNVKLKGTLPLLHVAVERANPTIVEALLNAGARVNALDPNGATALHRASCLPTAHTVEVLLKHDAEHTIHNVEGGTALHKAAACGGIGAIELLIRAGANVESRDAFGRTPIYYSDDPITMVYLADLGADVEAKSRGGLTPLHEAVRNDSPKAARILLGLGAAVNPRADDEKTPLDILRFDSDHREALNTLLRDHGGVRGLSPIEELAQRPTVPD